MRNGRPKDAPHRHPSAKKDNAETNFKSQHRLVTAFFLWILFLHAVGIYFFTKGFLLTRLVLDNRSECSEPPLDLDSRGRGGGCWFPKQFERAVVIIVDALRYDFTVPYEQPEHYRNALTVLYQTASATPENAFLLPFIADPPTTTLQRLKGLTTGTLPTFIDAGSNFAGTAIDEDNLIDQFRAANKTLVHLGDDTWHALFPGYFDANLTHAYDSLNVWDLHTVDNGVTEHLIPLLKGTDKWDVIVGHYLGVDHAGHRYGPDHPAMNAKLRQMDGVLRDVIAALDEETLLVVMGDHGMDAKGDHGGESEDEVEAALWMYSKQGVFGRTGPEAALPPSTAKSRPVAQIDLVPTLALLLGIPIPFNNLGAPIDEAFIGREGRAWKQLASAKALTAFQIKTYQAEYNAARALDDSITAGPRLFWNRALEAWDDLKANKSADMLTFKGVSDAFATYQQENLRVCKSLWARFDIPSMISGVLILFLAVGILLSFAISKQEGSRTALGTMKAIASGTGTALLCSTIMSFALPETSALDLSLISSAVGGVLGWLTTSWRDVLKSHSRQPRVSLWGWLSVLFTVSQSVGFASNSYTIWEDEVLLFFLSTFAVIATFSSFRQGRVTDRVLGIYHSLLFLLLTRAASFSRLCREEQMPSCKSTYYASATTSTSAMWQLFIPYIVALLLPTVIRSYYEGTKSYEGSAVFWLGFAFRLGLSGSALYWTLNAADDGDWFAGAELDWLSLPDGSLTNIRIFVAQIVFAIAFAAGTATFIWAPPCIRVETVAQNGGGESSRPKGATISIMGYANVHGSRYALLLSIWLLAVALVQKPMGGGAVAIMGWQIFSLLEIIDTNNLKDSSVGPIALGLLGSFYYFKTGHQATLASIQWDSAFVALKTIRYPWSPILVSLNTFGAQLLAVIAVPLLVIWKEPVKEPRLLNRVAGAMAIHLIYHAVINLATTMWAGHLRRHLMLYRIFSPRFMTGALVLLVVDLVGILVALGGFRLNTTGVAEVFGW